MIFRYDVTIKRSGGVRRVTYVDLVYFRAHRTCHLFLFSIFGISYLLFDPFQSSLKESQ